MYGVFFEVFSICRFDQGDFLTHIYLCSIWLASIYIYSEDLAFLRHKCLFRLYINGDCARIMIFVYANISACKPAHRGIFTHMYLQSRVLFSLII